MSCDVTISGVFFWHFLGLNKSASRDGCFLLRKKKKQDLQSQGCEWG